MGGYKDDCQLTLFPQFFIFDLSQALIFTPLLSILMFKYHYFILLSVKALLFIYGLALVVRPIMIYTCHEAQCSPNVSLYILWADDTTFYLIFYYMLFKMKVIVIAMEYWNNDGQDTSMSKKIS